MEEKVLHEQRHSWIVAGESNHAMTARCELGVAQSVHGSDDGWLRERYRRSIALHERAMKNIPGGHHLSGRPLVDPLTTPLYFERARGARIWDVDGHEYIDYLLAFGAHLLGYADPDVEHAAASQASRGRLVSLNHPLHVEFVETLVRRFSWCQMGSFFKTGSDATTAALRIARAHTGRRVVVRSGYHGWHDWCLPLEPWVPAGLDEQVLEFRASDPDSLARLLDAHTGQVAAVIVAPEMIIPYSTEILRSLRAVTAQRGVLLIMDEVKTGLRFAPDTLCQRAGIEPDLFLLSKALGNGFPVAVVLGKGPVMQSGRGMHYSGTFHGETTGMAAALRVLELIDERDVQEHVDRLGTRLLAGLSEGAARHRLPFVAYGEPLPAMPFMRAQSGSQETDARLTQVFFREVLARGVLLHPRHMWFVSRAHTESDIERTLRAADEAMAVAARVL